MKKRVKTHCLGKMANGPDDPFWWANGLMISKSNSTYRGYYGPNDFWKWNTRGNQGWESWFIVSPRVLIVLIFLAKCPKFEPLSLLDFNIIEPLQTLTINNGFARPKLQKPSLPGGDRIKRPTPPQSLTLLQISIDSTPSSTCGTSLSRD